MIKRICCLAMITGLGLGACKISPANGAPAIDVVETRPILEWAVANAEIVARIEITGREVLMEDAVECGYVYTANVIEALAGGQKAFKFFRNDMLDPGYERKNYLIFAYEGEDISSEIQSFFNNYSSPQEARPILCRSRADYFVPMGFDTLWEFNSNAAKEFGGEWIDPPVLPSVEWCLGWYDSDVPPESANRINYREIKQSGQQRLVIEWASAKKLIQEALANSPYPPGIEPQFYNVPKDDFVPATCEG